ncbi:MAG: SMC family ATPase [Gemmatimonadota bacterium]|nr:SMC family ATPase [Gemmatimonadota bacterium]
MLIERVRLVNFRQHEDTELVLGAGLTGVIGANGAGKTTILEAIAWALYGAEAARGTRDTIRRRGALPRAAVRVELQFVLGPHRYRVVRSLSSAELFQDGDTASIADSLAAVTEKITRLLGMSREEFFNTYFTGQKQLAIMGAMKPVERAQFLARVLGYDRLQRAQELLRERRAAARARLQAIEAGLPDPAELDAEEGRARERLEQASAREAATRVALEAAEARAADAMPRWSAAQQQRERVAALQSDLRLAEHHVTAARDGFSQLDRELVAASDARTRLESHKARLAPLEQLRAERHRLDEQAGFFTRQQAAQAQLEEARLGLQSLRNRAARLPVAEVIEQATARAEKLREALESLDASRQERRSLWDRDLQDARTKLVALRDQYKDLKEQLDRVNTAGEGGACPTCARPLGVEYEHVVGMLDRQLQDVMFNGNYFKSRVDQLSVEPPELKELDQQREQAEAELATATSVLAGLQAQAREGVALQKEQVRMEARVAEFEAAAREGPTGYDPNRHSEVRRLLGELEPLALQAERWRVAAERAETLLPEAERAERLLTEREAEAGAIRDALGEIGYSDESYEDARQAWEAAQRWRREAELGTVQARGDRIAAEEGRQAVARRREERDRRDAERRDAQRVVAMHNELDRAFTDLRTDLNTQLRPDLSDLASGFLRDLSGGKYSDLELDEDYVATIVEGGDPRPVISGGEEDIASLALRLAISQMIADRAGQPLSLLVLDEVFGSLDDERRGSVLELLRSLADRFPQVILITHIEGVREGVDRVIRVDFDAARGSASIREENAGGLDGLAA